MLWLAMAIPFLFCGGAYYLFKHRITWYEVLIPFVVSASLIVICSAISVTYQTTDTEYWGGACTIAEYYEDWNELVTYTVTVTDADGNTRTETRTRIDYHPPYWQLRETNGITVGISESQYNQIERKFGNQNFVDLGRWYYTNDGDLYQTKWDNSDEKLIHVTTDHWYENRVQTNNNIIDFQEFDEVPDGVYEYPPITENYKQNTILGPHNGPEKKRVDIMNAKLGPKRVFFLLYEDKKIQTAFDQEQYWKGGNRGELIIAIGVNKQREVQWCYPFAWSKSDSLKVETRNFINDMDKLDLVEVVDWLEPKIRRQFIARDFSEFDYIRVQPGTTATVLTFILTILANVGTYFWAVNNEFDADGSRNYRR